MPMMKHWIGQRCDPKLPGSARASRAGNRALAIANFLLMALLSGILLRTLHFIEVAASDLFGEDAEMCMRGLALPGTSARVARRATAKVESLQLIDRTD
jgi:hypothetical protein